MNDGSGGELDHDGGEGDAALLELLNMDPSQWYKSPCAIKV